MTMSNALLIPSYEPSDRVEAFLSQFEEGEFDYYLLVDDGSGERYRHIFDSIAKHTRFELIGYPTNKGKGHALKTGLKYLLSKHPDLEYIVTADSDGQHLKKDILNVKNTCESHLKSLVLGSRDFSKAPEKSQSGNRWSARYFKAVSGVYIKDTQTGLRGIPSCLFDLFLNTPGNRFEFEMRFLLNASSVIPIQQVTIETVYEDGNAGTHFRPVKDSIRIASGLITYALAATFFIVLVPVLFSIFRLNVFNSVGDSSVMDIFWCNFISIFGTGLLLYVFLQIFGFFNRVFFLKSLCKTLLILLPMMGIQFACTFGLGNNYGAMMALVVVCAFLFAGIKISLDYRFVFSMKKIS